MSKAFLARTMVPTEATKVQNSSMLSGKRYNQETLSPFDITQYRGAGRAGALPALHHRAEEEEEAFSNHVHTSRAAMQPTAFLRKGEGLGGRSNAVLAVEAKEKRAVHRVAPVLHKVRMPPAHLSRCVMAWPLTALLLPHTPLSPTTTHTYALPLLLRSPARPSALEPPQH